jgi:type III secretion system YscQ/HrcQ family protein
MASALRASTGRFASAAALRTARLALLQALPTLSASALRIRQKLYGGGATVLPRELLLIWMDPGPVRVGHRLGVALGPWQTVIWADNLHIIEPRLQNVEQLLPGDTLQALVQHALDPLLTGIETMAGLLVRRGELLVQEPGRTADEVDIGFMLLDTKMQPLVRGWLRAPQPAWDALDPARVRILDFVRRDPIPVLLTLQLGTLRLSVSELRELAVGDALRPFPRIPHPQDGIGLILCDRGGRVRIGARAVGEELILENAVTGIAQPQDRAEDADAPRLVGADRLDDVECEVSFELGVLRLTVAELARLRPGSVIRLGARVRESPVRVVVSGKLMARGELVVLGDELVVVIANETTELPR